MGIGPSGHKAADAFCLGRERRPGHASGGWQGRGLAQTWGQHALGAGLWLCLTRAAANAGQGQPGVACASPRGGAGGCGL